MSNMCEITGKRNVVGGSIVRKGLAKKQGGIGTHVVKNTKRIFKPNIHKKRFYVPELKSWVTLRVSAKALRDIQKNGILVELKKAKANGTLRKRIPGI